jgi:hypothetical protein
MSDYRSYSGRLVYDRIESECSGLLAVGRCLFGVALLMLRPGADGRGARS